MTAGFGALIGEPRAWRRWLNTAPLLAAVLPPVWIIRTVARDGLNVPFLDDWDLIPLLEKARAGSLGLADFWAQHNEHRPVLARAALLALARLTGWDIRWELAANVVVALATLATLSVLVVRTVGRAAPGAAPWLVAITSLMTFSLVQWQNWLWGWQLQVFMNALATCVTVGAVSRVGLLGPKPLLALAAATIGALSFATGLVLLAIVPVGLALDATTSRSWRAVRITTMIAVAIATFYFIGLQHPPYHPSRLVALEKPLAFVTFVLAYLGAPLAGGLYVTGFDGDVVVFANALLGAAGILVVIGGGVWLHLSWPASRDALRPWFLLAFYAMVSGAMTGVGRLGSGLNQALMSRYTTISALFWISVAAVAALTLAHALRDGAVGRASAAIVIVATIVGSLIAGAGYVLSWTFGARLTSVFHDGVRRGGECLRFYRIAPDPCLRLLNPDVPRLRDDARRLEALALGPFVPAGQERAFATYTVAEAARPAGWVERIEVDPSGTEFVVSGWGMDPASGTAAPAILIVVEGNVLGRARTGEHRADVAKQLRADALLHSGWSFRFGAFRVGSGFHVLEAYALLDRDRIAKLGGGRVIEVRQSPA